MGRDKLMDIKRGRKEQKQTISKSPEQVTTRQSPPFSPRGFLQIPFVPSVSSIPIDSTLPIWVEFRRSPTLRDSTGRWLLALNTLAQGPTLCSWPWRSCTMHHANTVGRISSAEKMVRQFPLRRGAADLNRTAFQDQIHDCLFLARFHQPIGNAG